MGVEYRHFLIPQDRTLCPSTAVLLKLIEELSKHRWIRTPQSPVFARMENYNIPAEAVQTGGFVRSFEGARPLPRIMDTSWLDEQMRNDSIIRWPVGSLKQSGLQYPLSPMPDMDQEDLYYEVQIQMSVDYVYRVSELIGPFSDTLCSCGEELEFDAESGGPGLFYCSRLRAVCSGCEELFDPRLKTADVENGRTREARLVAGGATSRFAIVIDCGKAIPDSATITASPELLLLCEQILGCSLEQIGDYY